MKKLNNEDVDKRLIDRDIKRLGEYVNTYVAIELQCLVVNCKYIWKTCLRDIFAGHGCPKCAGKAPLDNITIDVYLLNKNIKRLGDSINNRTPISFQCLVENCKYIWKTTPGSLLNNKSGCPSCAGVARLDTKIVDEHLIERNIKRLDLFINNKTKINFKCLIETCGHTWKTGLGSILNHGTGCPKCAGLVKLTNKIVDERLTNRNIKRLDEYINAVTEINFQCLNCDYTWMATPSRIFNGSGCPQCADISLNNDIVDKRLQGKNIKRLDNYINIITGIDFQCLMETCGYIWNTCPSVILNKGYRLSSLLFRKICKYSL